MCGVDAVIGFVGVALGAVLAPGLDWLRQHRTRGEQRRTELRELVAAFVSLSGDQINAESSDVEATWALEVGFRANAARFRLRLLAPKDVVDAADEFAEKSDALRKRVLAVGWDEAVDEWIAWKAAEDALIAVTKGHIEHM